jgi:Leucine-rich repeat (LRR) protein
MVLNLWFECPRPGIRVDLVDSNEIYHTGGNVTLAGAEGMRDSGGNESASIPFENSEREGEGEREHVFYGNLISYIKVKLCQLSLDTFHAVANMSDLRIFAMLGPGASSTFTDLQDSPHLCEAFQHVVGMGIIADSNANSTIPLLATCKGYLNEMVEVAFNQAGLSAFPESLKAAMPNLRALMMDGNQLTSGMEFPWRSGYAVLPRNLSRSHFFNTRYTFDNQFYIAPNLFRRILFLSGNRIANLTCFGLTGEFQYVSVERNTMRFISDCGVFQDVRDLRFLSLANNELETLPENLFVSLTNLTRLDLQHNLLTHLHSGLFRQLRNLQVLNLAGNRLTALQDNVFVSLTRLTDLTLSNNTISNLSDTAISRFAVDMKSLDLSYTTLTTFPVIALLLPGTGVRSFNLDHTHVEVLDFADMDRRTTAFELSRSAVNPSGGKGPELQDLPTPANPRAVYLRHSRLRSLVFFNSSFEAVDTFAYVLKYYTFFVEGSPLQCHSSVLNVTHQIQRLLASRVLSGQEPSLQELR